MSQQHPPSAVAHLLPLAGLSVLGGALTGLLVAAFRLALEAAEVGRGQFVDWAQAHALVGLALLVGGLAGCTALAAWLVRRFAPHASGSGIPQVELALQGEAIATDWRLLPVKFFGGVLAIGSGLALGREGPSVQMGAVLCAGLGRWLRLSPEDARVLLAAGAGAGLATAFNAPIAGAVFVLEELLRRFDLRSTLATLGASAGALAAAHLLLGHGPDFQAPALGPLPTASLPAFVLLGLLAGLAGMAYNRAILGCQALAQRSGWPVEARAALIGALVALLAWWAPGWVGGGDPLTQQALLGVPTLALCGLFLLRFALGAVSYAAATPGGLFAPMLVLGAQLGLLFGGLWQAALDSSIPLPALVIAGMAAFFTAVVRAPLTGIILVGELTGSFSLLLPMVVASFAALLLPSLRDDPPIYDALRERLLRQLRRG